MERSNRSMNFESVIRKRPIALGTIHGNSNFPQILGSIRFYDTVHGTLVVAEVRGLPSNSGICNGKILGFHIHEGGSCSGNTTDPFANAGMHYNPYDCPHPYHAGDLPPLFVCSGYAYSVFLTDRFTANEVIGKSVIIHSSVDDFTTQPSGNSGIKIACGEIKRYGI